MSKKEIIKFVEKIENIVCNEGQKSIQEYEKKMLEIGKELVKRYKITKNCS
jgi:hypothetical protein